MGNKNSGNKNKGLYYTNGINDRRIPVGEEIPVGWYRGRVNIHNTTKGKIRISDGVNEKYISKDDSIPEGWYKGRKPSIAKKAKLLGESNLNSIWVNNGYIEKYLPPNSLIPEGFVRGRLPMKKEQKEKCSKSHIGKHHTEEARRKMSLHNNNNRKKAFETIKKEYGSKENYFKQIHKKVDKTKQLRHSFNQSNIENNYYKKLCEKYDKRNVLRNYKTLEYPYRCDFYIKSLNLYIEINNHWTHGEHPFDKNNPKDVNTLNKWKEKSENSQFYKNAIETWTIRDVEKLNCLRNNNLNFKIIYPNEIIEK